MFLHEIILFCKLNSLILSFRKKQLRQIPYVFFYLTTPLEAGRFEFTATLCRVVSLSLNIFIMLAFEQKITFLLHSDNTNRSSYPLKLRYATIVWFSTLCWRDKTGVFFRRLWRNGMCALSKLFFTKYLTSIANYFNIFGIYRH